MLTAVIGLETTEAYCYHARTKNPSASHYYEKHLGATRKHLYLSIFIFIRKRPYCEINKILKTQHK